MNCMIQGLANPTIVDLTHAFFPGQPHPAVLPDQEVRPVDLGPDNDSLVQEYRFVGQWGTHIDAPVHFDRNGATLDELPVEQVLRPLVVLDIHQRVLANPDAIPSMSDVYAWEARHGLIPEGAFVALRTDWSLRWPSAAAMDNVGMDGFSHRPGWSHEVLQFLVDERHVAAIGHETSDTDPGYAVSAFGDHSLERYFLGTGRWQVELMSSLRSVPASGALIFVGWPKPRGGSGFPVRAVALWLG